MASTTRSDFGNATEAVEVAEHFAGQVKGRTILVTGVNREGIGFVTAQALVGSDLPLQPSSSS